MRRLSRLSADIEKDTRVSRSSKQSDCSDEPRSAKRTNRANLTSSRLRWLVVLLVVVSALIYWQSQQAPQQPAVFDEEVVTRRRVTDHQHQAHACQAVLITSTDLPDVEAAAAEEIYLDEVAAVRNTSDFAKVVQPLSQKLSVRLGGTWDIFSAGEGMLSYALGCVAYVELAGEAWIALLCQTALSHDIPLRCSQLITRSNGTLSLQRYAALLSFRGQGLPSDHASFADVRLAEAHTVEGPLRWGGRWRGYSVLVTSVLSETPVASSVGPLFASAVRTAIEARDRAHLKDGSLLGGSLHVDACNPDRARSTSNTLLVTRFETAHIALHLAHLDVTSRAKG